jgi:hypothetical protein
VIGPPASIPSIIASSYQSFYGKEPNEVPQISFVHQCHVIVQVIGETPRSGITFGQVHLTSMPIPGINYWID